MKTSVFYFGMVALGVALFFGAFLVRTSGQVASATVRIDDNDLGGVVSSSMGPEAGVWVVAETTDLSTKYVKIVVTDGQGRYVLPDLPKANYSVGGAYHRLYHFQYWCVGW